MCLAVPRILVLILHKKITAVSFVSQRRQQLGIAEICSEGAIDGGKEQSLKRVDNKAPIMTGRRRGDGAKGSTRGFSF